MFVRLRFHCMQRVVHARHAVVHTALAPPAQAERHHVLCGMNPPVSLRLTAPFDKGAMGTSGKAGFLTLPRLSF